VPGTVTSVMSIWPSPARRIGKISKPQLRRLLT
jgi:hypothetical protein